MGAELAGLVAVASAGFGIAASRWRGRRRSGFRGRRRGRLARREPYPGRALPAMRRHPDYHRDPDTGRGAAEREPERVQAGRVSAGRFLAVTGLEVRDYGNPRAWRGGHLDAHLGAGPGAAPGHRCGAGERGWRRRRGRRWREGWGAGDYGGRRRCAHAGGRLRWPGYRPDHSHDHENADDAYDRGPHLVASRPALAGRLRRLAGATRWLPGWPARPLRRLLRPVPDRSILRHSDSPLSDSAISRAASASH